MRIDVRFVPQSLELEKPKDRTVAVVDVLRASTTMAYAFANGADRIIPVASIEAATSLAMKLGEEVLLCGEREGKRIDGFHLGNSPQEYVSDKVAGKTLLFTTTNGTKAIARCEGAREVVIASLVNISAVVEHLLQAKRGVTLVCAGKFGQFSMEDGLCAGMMVARLREAVGGDLEVGDSAGAAEIIYRSSSADTVSIMRNCEHGRYLSSLGLDDDLAICAEVDALSVVPVVRQGRIRHQDDGPREDRNLQNTHPKADA